MTSTFHCISADSHVVEPPATWTDHIDPKYRERAPRVIRQNGEDMFMCEGSELLGVGACSSAGHPTTAKPRGTFEEDVYPGAYDPHARLKDMAADGVDAEVIYPTMALRMFGLTDTGFQIACFRAYNDWLTGFCGAQPQVLKGIALVSLDDVHAAIAELHRTKKMGLVGAAVPLYLADDDGLQYDSRHFDPFWAAAQDLEVPISLHTVTDKRGMTLHAVQQPGRDQFLRAVMGRAVDPVWIQKTLTLMIYGGVFLRFPRLRVVSVENDAGWAGYFVERIDYLFTRRRSDATYDIGGGPLTPGDYLKRNVYFTFMRDRSTVTMRSAVGVERLMWSNDYPHSDSTWPRSQQLIQAMFEGVPQAEKHRILAGNAADLYGFK